MLSKEEIEKAKEKLKEISIETELDFVYKNIEIILEYIEQLEQEKADRTSADNYENSYIAKLESDKQKLIEKLEERIKSVDKCYDELIKPYYDEKLNIINTSFMSKKEKEEFINKRNCLLVQKHCYEEILEILKGENHDNQARIYRDYK